MPVKRDRKTQILQHASRLFGQDGYDKVTVKRLAHAVGISEPALYRHYESKDAIYDAVLCSIEEKLDYVELFSSLEKEDDVHAVLSGLARHILDFFARNSDLYRLLLYSTLRGHEKARDVFRIVRGSYIDFLRARLDNLEERGLILGKQNEITARCFVGMVFDCSLGYTMWKGFQGKVYEPDEVVGNNISIYARGLTAESS